MLELDIILNHFMDRHFEELSLEQIGQLESLLACSDPELYAWFLSDEQPADKELNDIVELVKLYR